MCLLASTAAVDYIDDPFELCIALLGEPMMIVSSRGYVGTYTGVRTEGGGCTWLVYVIGVTAATEGI